MRVFLPRGWSRPVLALCVLPLLGACSGSGSGLDSNGVPVGAASSGAGAPVGTAAGMTPDFASIQANVFTPICAPCHAGASAPEGMQLNAGVSYSMIVGVPSQEMPSLDRIRPGDADDSYLLQKIEGTAAVGAQMPDGCPATQPCLDAATIGAIRQWIAGGAPADAASTAGPMPAATAP